MALVTLRCAPVRTPQVVKRVPCVVVSVQNDTPATVYVWDAADWLGKVPPHSGAVLTGCGNAHMRAEPVVWLWAAPYGFGAVRVGIGPHFGPGPYPVHVRDPTPPKVGRDSQA